MTGQNQKRNNTCLFHFITGFICAMQTACLVHENVAVEPTMSEHLSPVTVNNETVGENTTYCVHLSEFCNEKFPDKKMDCLFFLLNHICLNTFNTDMNHSDADWCDWGNVSGLYSNLSICTEEISDCLRIPWPNPLVEQMFLDIHSQYFQDCPSEELSDPPPPIVFALVITPICLIPVMVSLVVLKTKNGDGSP